MRHHEHYLGWTIEWQRNSGYDIEFWICTPYFDIETKSMKTARYLVEVISTDTCKTLIEKIILEQRNSARRIVADYNSEVAGNISEPADDDDDDDEDESKGVDLYLA